MTKEFEDLTSDVEKIFSDEKVMQIVTPFIERLAHLRSTVSAVYPHWLDSNRQPPHGDDRMLHEEYSLIDGLVISVAPDLNRGIRQQDVQALAFIAEMLFTCNGDQEYTIKVGSQPALMDATVVSELGKACAECFTDANPDKLAIAITYALTNIVDRMDIYLDPDR